MKKLLKGTLTGLLLVTLATPGFAENRKGAVNLTPFVGGYMLDHAQHEENRPIFGLRAGYNFTQSLGVEVMGGYSLTETKYKYGSRETDVYRYGAEILYHFMPNSSFVPFVAIGGGGTNFNTPKSPSTENHHAGLVDYGLGFKYFVAPNVAIRGDVRHAILINDIGHNNLEYSTGLTFQFGGERKAVAAIEDTSAVADTVAPTVSFTTPVNGDDAVHVNQKAGVAFSEPMDQNTISASTFTLKQGSKPVSGKVTSTDSTATFTPENYLEEGKPYTATVTTGAKDLAGNALANNYIWEFSTGKVADTTPPTVTFTSPVNGAPATPVSQKVNAAFSEPMDTATITSSTFTLKQGQTPVSGNVKATGSTATFSPSRNFEKGKVYTATVTTGAKDLAGNALTRDYVWDFTAFAEPRVIGCLATLNKSHFDFDSAKINENGKTILNDNALVLKNDPNMTIRIAGHTSAAGSENYNQKLSERRAQSVKDYLVKTGGIDANRISTIGYGEKYPAQHEANPSDTLSAAALANMRVVVEIIE